MTPTQIEALQRNYAELQGEVERLRALLADADLQTVDHVDVLGHLEQVLAAEGISWADVLARARGRTREALLRVYAEPEAGVQA